MNLMFRKNFHEGSSTCTKSGIGKFQSKANRGNRSREYAANNLTDDFHYRTHLFFAPNRSGLEQTEENCRKSSQLRAVLALPSMPHEVDAPQPLVDRDPSVSVLRWKTNCSARSGNDSLGSPSGELLAPQSSSSLHAAQVVARKNSEVATGSNVCILPALDRDCFLIPVQNLDRFLPIGIPLSANIVNREQDSTIRAPISVHEISARKPFVMVHLMSPFEAVDPLLESPLAQPLLKQRNIAMELLNEAQHNSFVTGGMLLANMEKNAEFPFIAYYLINAVGTDASHFYTTMRTSALSKFEPKQVNYTAAHTLDLYNEVAAICRPPLKNITTEKGSLKQCHTARTGYIISVFKVFEGDDGERFERNWLYWTGARVIYRHLPYSAGLRSITLYKSSFQKGDKMYLLICECSELLSNIEAAIALLPPLRARLCGYTALYRPIQAF